MTQIKNSIPIRHSGHLPAEGKNSIENLHMPPGHRKGRRPRRSAVPGDREACGRKGKGSRSRRVKARWRRERGAESLKSFVARQSSWKEGQTWLTAK